MPKKYDDVYLQRKVIQYIAERLPHDEVWCPIQGRGHLEGLLREAKQFVPGATTRCLRLWWEYYLRNGECKAIIDKRQGYLSRKYKQKTRRGGWNADKTAKLQEIVDVYPELYLDEIQEVFFHKTGEFYSQATLWKKLVSECGYSLQVATDRSTNREQEQIEGYFADLEAHLAHLDQLVFVDETAKDRNSSRRRRSWSKRGITPFRPSYLAPQHAIRYTMIGACDINGFILEACDTVEREHGANDPDPTRGTVDGQRFKLWVMEKLIPILGNFENSEPRSIVVLDNASVHHVEGIVEMIEDAGAKVIFTAAYCPEFNPIETMFRIYKSTLRRVSRNMGWADAHVTALQSVTPTKARALFRHAGVPGCEQFKDELSKEEEEKLLAVVAVVAVVLVLGKRKRAIGNASY